MRVYTASARIEKRVQHIRVCRVALITDLFWRCPYRQELKRPRLSSTGWSAIFSCPHVRVQNLRIRCASSLEQEGSADGSSRGDLAACHAGTVCHDVPGFKEALGVAPQIAFACHGFTVATSCSLLSCLVSYRQLRLSPSHRLRTQRLADCSTCDWRL
mmetsp:Transcript_144696/g.360673  ORF Transcript_144696/g.360673 Transcript_144696/m.360673 type:complete len:158 (-) Transcript_144696:6-479(-)